MDGVDADVLDAVARWQARGDDVLLATVARTWGSAPRPVGAMMALAACGRIAGSVSGGCIEDDLLAKVAGGFRPGLRPHVQTYGVTADEAHRFGLPCGGTLELVIERVTPSSGLDAMREAIGHGRLGVRELDLRTGLARIRRVTEPAAFGYTPMRLTVPFGPRWRIIVIGDGQLTQHLVTMALPLGYQVVICDPREIHEVTRDTPRSVHVTHAREMPDDLIVRLRPDGNTAIVALTHDPKLDDMALLEALKSEAFYVGAIGSHRNQASRRERLAMFDLSAAQIARLHGPVGLPLGARTPPEIALAILAEITALRNGVSSAISVSHLQGTRECRARTA
ncbi:putative xanthine dehydrogenase subunit A [Pandoraea eparura]|uniref:Putative xanthine dehydrogenase subunit A n=1 Tax=Pandoraea eparura TaxID=2508291 RepID=A0A5E4SB77_9BURK|nr:XdhC family protein [Pandoraea eparura]VVD72867.1 putative xanthine dehydrogenase subunit A [Pandoraea eparura]